MIVEFDIDIQFSMDYYNIKIRCDLSQNLRRIRNKPVLCLLTRDGFDLFLVSLGLYSNII